MLKNVITKSVFLGGAIAKFLAIGLGGSISIDLPQPTTWRFSHEWESTPKSKSFWLDCSLAKPRKVFLQVLYLAPADVSGVDIIFVGFTHGRRWYW